MYDPQIMEAASGQLAAAIYSLIAALLGRRHDGPLLLWCIYNLSFARWGLEGMNLCQTAVKHLLCYYCCTCAFKLRSLTRHVWLFTPECRFY